MIIGTISSLNYLHKTEVMAKSVKEHHPKAKVIVCLVEREMHPDVKIVPFFDKVILADDLGIANFDQYVFKYDAPEATMSLKSQLLKYLLENENSHDQILYLDSDIRLYSPLIEIQSLLKTYPIVLTPHDIQFGPRDVYLWNGIFNAGFIGIRRSNEAKDFTEWWAKKLERYCYIDRNLKLYYDQGWVKLVPTYFETYILRHPGYNLAFWNFHERNIGLLNSKQYTVNDNYSLRFFHLSNYSNFLKDAVENDNNEILQNLYFQYLEELKQTRLYHLSNEPWSYDFFNNGSKIKKVSRRKYLNNPVLQNHTNPFDLANEDFKVFSKKQ